MRAGLLVVLLTALVMAAIIGVNLFVPAGEDPCEKGDPSDAPYLTIHNPEPLDEDATVYMAGNTLKINVLSGDGTVFRFELRNDGLGHVSVTLDRTPSHPFYYKVLGRTRPISPAITMCAGFTATITVFLADVTPGEIHFVADDVPIGPAMIRID